MNQENINNPTSTSIKINLKNKTKKSITVDILSQKTNNQIDISAYINNFQVEISKSIKHYPLFFNKGSFIKMDVLSKFNSKELLKECFKTPLIIRDYYSRNPTRHISFELMENHPSYTSRIDTTEEFTITNENQVLFTIRPYTEMEITFKCDLSKEERLKDDSEPTIPETENPELEPTNRIVFGFHIPTDFTEENLEKISRKSPISTPEQDDTIEKGIDNLVLEARKLLEQYLTPEDCFNYLRNDFLKTLIIVFTNYNKTPLSRIDFIKFFVQTYLEELNFIKENPLPITNQSFPIIINIKNNTDKVISNVPVLNPDFKDCSVLEYSTFGDSKNANTNYSADRITYEMIVNKLLYYKKSDALAVVRVISRKNEIEKNSVITFKACTDYGSVCSMPYRMYSKTGLDIRFQKNMADFVINHKPSKDVDFINLELTKIQPNDEITLQLFFSKL
jgi:hypothetical protein